MNRIAFGFNLLKRFEWPKVWDSSVPTICSLCVLTIFLLSFFVIKTSHSTEQTAFIYINCFRISFHLSHFRTIYFQPKKKLFFSRVFSLWLSDLYWLHLLNFSPKSLAQSNEMNPSSWEEQSGVHTMNNNDNEWQVHVPNEIESIHPFPSCCCWFWHF